jgi:hypothetical protein
LNGAFVPDYSYECAFTDLFDRSKFAQMKLTLLVVLLPVEAFTLFFKENAKLGKLFLGIKGVVPSRFVAEANLED